MFRLHVIQAEFGDCLLLEYGQGASRFILIDGGPQGTFSVHLRPMLMQIAQAGAPLDLVVLSHVDNDHVLGLIEYLGELRQNQGLPVPPKLWHNSFDATIDPNGIIAAQLGTLISPARAMTMAGSGLATFGIQEGVTLRGHAFALQMAINDGFTNNVVTVDNAPGAIPFDNLELIVIGPTEANLRALEREWIDWLNAHGPAILSNNPFVMSNADRSIPNLSSIMLFAKAEGRTMLLTGDGRSDHLLDGLLQAGLLDINGSLHVDLLKLPHHGSNRNITKTFFRKITADTYVASANGRDGNPDLATLIWLVESAAERGQSIEIAVTNDTPSVQQLIENYPEQEYTYAIRILPQGQHSIEVQ